MYSQPDEEFSGFLSGLETSILLNSKLLHFKIQIPSKQAIYQSTIEYNTQDPVFLQVKKVFKNLNLLFEYINEYSEDDQRVKVDLKELNIKIVKNQGPRRLKNAPILVIPLKKIFIYEKNRPTKLQKDIETALKFNEILRFKYEYEKRERKTLMNQFNQLKDEVFQMIKSSDIKIVHIQHDILETEKNTKQHNANKNQEKRLLIEYDWENVLVQNKSKEQNDEKSLFFEDESLNEFQLRSDRFKRAIQTEERSTIEPQIAKPQVFTYDPFSYL